MNPETADALGPTRRQLDHGVVACSAPVSQQRWRLDTMNDPEPSGERDPGRR
jgi:hypothetical protein